MKVSIVAAALLMTVAGAALAQTSPSTTVPPGEKNGAKPQTSPQHEGGTPVPNSNGATGSASQPQSGDTTQNPPTMPQSGGTGKAGGGSK